MDIQADCLIGCQISMLLRVMEAQGTDADTQIRVMREHNRMLRGAAARETWRTMSDAYHMLRERIGVDDPLAEAKRQHNRTALDLLPAARALIAGQPDPLHAAVKLAAVGNMIDFSFGDVFDVETAVKGSMDLRLEIDDYGLLLERLTSAKALTLICDNAGEIVFDRLLLDEIRAWRAARGLPLLRMTAIVRAAPIVNDALRADAEAAGLAEAATVVDSGCGFIGFPPSEAGGAALTAAKTGDIILSKGLGNFETTYELPEFSSRSFYIFKAKCGIVAGIMKVPPMSIVLAAGSRHPHRNGD